MLFVCRYLQIPWIETRVRAGVCVSVSKVEFLLLSHSFLFRALTWTSAGLSVSTSEVCITMKGFLPLIARVYALGVGSCLMYSSGVSTFSYLSLSSSLLLLEGRGRKMCKGQRGRPIVQFGCGFRR